MQGILNHTWHVYLRNLAILGSSLPQPKRRKARRYAWRVNLANPYNSEIAIDTFVCNDFRDVKGLKIEQGFVLN